METSTQEILEAVKKSGAVLPAPSIWERIAQDNDRRAQRLARECGHWQYRAEEAERKVARLEPQAARLRLSLDAIRGAIDPVEEAVNALDRHGVEIRGLSGALADLQAIGFDRITNAAG